MHIATKYDIGDELKDKVSGFIGIVLGITQYSTGCIHYGLSAQVLGKEGDVKNWEWFDETRLNLLKQEKIEFPVFDKKGGPQPNAPEM